MGLGIRGWRLVGFRSGDGWVWGSGGWRLVGLGIRGGDL